MTTSEEPVYFAPAGQPRSVHEVAERLFGAYTVDGGAVHLAGCRLDDRLFLKVADAGQARAGTFYMDDSGQAVEESYVRSLGMDETIPWVRPPEMPPDRLKEIVDKSIASSRQRWGAEGEWNPALIWCKYVEGKLRFTIGDQSADLPFEGWTRTLKPPPFICPHSGAASYHITATDDGRIVAAESIRVCAESGRRVLGGELVACDVTGLAVLPEHTRTCPISMQPVLTRELATCVMCSQQMSPKVVENGRCLACRSTRPIAKTEAPLDELLSNHPALSRWAKWEAAETAEVHILIAAGWWNRLLLVVDKSDATVRLAAVGHRFRSQFSAIAVERIDEPI